MLRQVIIGTVYIETSNSGAIKYCYCIKVGLILFNWETYIINGNHLIIIRSDNIISLNMQASYIILLHLIIMRIAASALIASAIFMRYNCLLQFLILLYSSVRRLLLPSVWFYREVLSH